MQTKPIKKSSRFTWKQVLKNLVNASKSGVAKAANGETPNVKTRAIPWQALKKEAVTTN